MTSKKQGSTDADLLAALDSPLRRQPGVKCGMTRVLHDVTPELRLRLEAILDEMKVAREQGHQCRYTCPWLARTLTEHGHKVSALTINVHVNRKCACE